MPTDEPPNETQPLENPEYASLEDAIRNHGKIYEVFNSIPELYTLCKTFEY